MYNIKKKERFMRNPFALNDGCPKNYDLHIDQYTFHFDFDKGCYNEPKLKGENEYVFFDERVIALKNYIKVSQQVSNTDDNTYRKVMEHVKKLIPDFFIE